MQEGPSKEELQNYWNNSRQYFDELAKYYREADSAYYNKYIAPFYNNPFRTNASNPSGKNASAKIVAVLALMLAIGIAGGAAAFFLSYSKSDNNKYIPEKKVISDHPKADSVNINALGDSVKAITNSANYNVGLTYFHSKEYDNAEKYFKMVPPNDKNYVKSQKYLKEIEIIREVKETPPDEPKSNNNRRKPIERVR